MHLFTILIKILHTATLFDLNHPFPEAFSVFVDVPHSLPQQQ